MSTIVKPGPSAPADIWSFVLSQLKATMTWGTYSSLFLGSTFIEIRPDDDGLEAFVVEFADQSIVDTINARHEPRLTQMLSSIAQHPYRLEAVASASQSETPSQPTINPPDEGQSDTKEQPGGAAFQGFTSLSSNWSPVPDVFFTEVAPNADGVVIKLVAQVIKQTIGTFEDKRKNRRREEWPTTNATSMKTAGINSKTSFHTALWDARASGYIILRELTDPAETEELSKKMGHICRYTLRIRYMDDPIDYPATPRPGYGSKKK